jgi:cytoskeletal protein CcmA (bactofilin family)
MDQNKPDDKKADDTSNNTEGESLENNEDDAGGGSNVTTEASANEPVVESGKVEPQGKRGMRKLWEKLNIYLLLFVLVLMLSGGFATILYLRNKTATTDNNDITGQQLSSETLQKLATNGIQVGDPKQVLNIQSNSVFGGTVLVKGELQVAGGLKIGSGDLAISDVSINGSANINQLQAQTVAVAGNTAIQGQLSVQKDLSVSGSGTFGGALTASQIITAKLQLSGDLTLTRHIVAGGGLPTRANGAALGSGGTSSISGSDTAGSISINTGSGASAGCFLTITFAQAFTASPRIIVTPVGSSAAGMAYYINRTSTNFSVCTASVPPSNATFGFDYIAFN